MTDSGLKESEINTINAVFQCHSEISKAILFGSRYERTAQTSSASTHFCALFERLQKRADCFDAPLLRRFFRRIFRNEAGAS